MKFLGSLIDIHMNESPKLWVKDKKNQKLELKLCSISQKENFAPSLGLKTRLKTGSLQSMLNPKYSHEDKKKLQLIRFCMEKSLFLRFGISWSLQIHTKDTSQQ
jgi:hypothetical protein